MSKTSHLSDNPAPKLLLIDGYGFIFRAFYALPSLTTPKGIPIGAIQGFTTMLMHILKKQQYTAIAVVLDKGSSRDTIRHQLHVDYKANRITPPCELISQFLVMREMLEAFGIPYLEQQGVEADDIIAAYTEQGIKQGYKVTVASGDKDLLQLVREDLVHIYDPIKKKTLDCRGVFEKMGVHPQQIVDYLALTGDTSDNIPGVPGIGPKTASALLQRYQNLNQIYNNLINIQPFRTRTLLEKNREQAFLSHQLVTLHIDQVQVQKQINDLIWLGIEANAHNIATFSRQYGLSVIQQKYLQTNLYSHLDDIKVGSVLNPVATDLLVQDFLQALQVTKKVAIYHRYDIKGQVPHLTLSDGNITLDLYPNSIPNKIITEVLKNETIIKVCHGIHEIFQALHPYYFGEFIEDCSVLHTPSCHDVAYMAYTLGTGQRYDLHSLISRYLPHNTNVDTGKALLMLEEILRDKLKQESLIELYQIDQALMSILLKMEYHGILVDKDYLQQLGREFTVKLNDIAIEVYKEAGINFNIASPKQVGEVLFQHLKIQHKTKSTSADVLEELAMQGFTIAEMIQEWRHIAKLQGTYIEGLLSSIEPNTKRVHSTFNAISTLTGRLSASSPNLQSIPIRSIDGAKIRKAFIAKEGYELISADYSQIELRILANIAELKSLQEALNKGLDIHTLTASQVFGIPMEAVTESWRRRAKAINFGIIYGISSFGLAKNLGISNTEADTYIKKYFCTYPGIEAYMNKTIIFAREKGYVSTILGRKCYIINIDSKNPVLRKLAERSAINAPIQGSAADIMRKTMVNLPYKLQQQLLLQVHDELIFEVPQQELNSTMLEIENIMINSHKFEVPLSVKVRHGKSWG